MVFTVVGLGWQALSVSPTVPGWSPPVVFNKPCLDLVGVKFEVVVAPAVFITVTRIGLLGVGGFLLADDHKAYNDTLGLSRDSSSSYDLPPLLGVTAEGRQQGYRR